MERDRGGSGPIGKQSYKRYLHGTRIFAQKALSKRAVNFAEFFLPYFVNAWKFYDIAGRSLFPIVFSGRAAPFILFYLFRSLAVPHDPLPPPSRVNSIPLLPDRDPILQCRFFAGNVCLPVRPTDRPLAGNLLPS